MGKRLAQTGQLVSRNSSAFVIVWLLSLALVQLGERVFGGWPASETGQFVVCAAGVPIALALRARLAAYFWAAMAAFSASELCVHAFYGIRAAQGAPTHFAVMGAAMLSVTLGSALSARATTDVSLSSIEPSCFHGHSARSRASSRHLRPIGRL